MDASELSNNRLEEMRDIKFLSLAKIAFGLSIALFVSALAIGLFTYQHSFEMMQKGYQQLYLNKAQMIIKLAEIEHAESENATLNSIFHSWSDNGLRPPDEYICVFDQQARLLLHSADPETVGNYVGKNRIFNKDTGKEADLEELVTSPSGYVGSYIASDGTAQTAAFVPIPDKSWHLGIHRSSRALKQEIRDGFKPIIIGFYLVVGILMPSALFLIYRAYNISHKKMLSYSEALRESENRYHSLVDAMPQGLYRTDLTGRIIFFNRALRENFHPGLKEDGKLTVNDLYPDLDAKNILANDINVIRTAETLHQELKYDPSGRGDACAYMETVKSPVFNSRGEIVGIQAISWDITDKKLAQEKLQHTKAHLEALLNSVPTGIIAVDTQARLTMMNQKAEEILGAKAEAYLNRHITEMIPDSNLTRTITENEREIGKTFRWKEKTLLVSRSPIYDGQTVKGGVSVFLDQSELESVQNQLEAMKILNDEFSSLVDSAYDGILTTDEEKVVKVNASYGRITGLSPAAIEGRRIAELDAKKHVFLAVVQELFTQVRNHRRSLTLQQTLNSGNKIFVTGCPVLDSQGNVRRVVMNIRDVTELKHHEYQYDGVCQELPAVGIDEMGIYGGIVAESTAMRNLLDLCRRVGQVDSTVLLSGETGVGKDVLSRVIHQVSNRRDKPFVSINCGAIPENLLESELFGYEKGAFSGALTQGKPGLFEQAGGGIVFLDEVGELPLSLQVKLLKVLQDQKCRRLGGIKDIDLDGRVIAATNRNLSQMVKEGTFRQDLFYRLYVFPIDIPPLRDRREDILPLALKFLKIYNTKYELSRSLGQEILKVMEAYDWPGNVRELQNVVERMVVSADNEMLVPRHLPDNIYQQAGKSDVMDFPSDEIMDLKTAHDALDRRLIANALAQTQTTREAAKILGVTHSTVIRKAQKLHMGKTARA
jgi:PAS domain S-box-containing protein